MARIFLSHSSKDGEQAGRMLAWLRGAGFTDTFLDIDKHGGLMPGDDWERRLYREIAGAEAVVLILTANWFASKWCFAEFIQARALGKAIFPIIETPTGESFVSPDIQHLDLVKDREGGLERLGSELTQLALNARGRFPWDKGRSPFPGLLAFDEADAAIYFGRDDDIRRVIERLNARRAQGGAKLVAVLGASGSGKSSLLRAGVLPRLRRDARNWIVLPPFRPQLHPVDEFAQALAAGLGANANWRACRAALMASDLRRSLSELARDLRAAHGANEAQILVSIDQAEELFVTADKADAERMLAALHAALDEHLQFIVLLTLRSDYLGRLQEVPGLQFEEFSLKPMPIERVRDIIEGPAKVAGLTVEEGFIAAAVKDAATGDALPLLAFTLRELRDRDGGADRLTLASYEALGDPAAGLSPLENALRQRADAVLAKADPDADTLAALRAAFVPAMVRVNEEGEYVRRPAALDALPAKAHALLRAFADARLLVIKREGEVTVVEVAHEALLRKWPRLRAWLDEEREFLIGKAQLERALLDWQKADAAHKTAALLYGLPLIRAEQWLAKHLAALSEAERAFIEASRDNARAEVRRRARVRRVLAAGLVLLVAMLAGGGWLWREWALEQERTRAEGRRAEAALLAFRAQAYLSSNALREAARHALQAFGLSPSGETRSALLQTVLALSPHLARVLEVGELRPSALAWAPDGATIAIGGLSGEARAWRPFAASAKGDTDVVFGAAQGAGNAEAPVRSVAWSREYGAIVLLGDGRLVMRAPGAERASENAVLIPDIRDAAIDATGLRIVAASQAEPVVYFFACTRASAASRTLACARKQIADDYATVTAISADASRAAVGLESGELVIVDLVSGAALPRIDLGAQVRSLAFDRQGRLAAGTVAGRTVVLGAQGETVAELPAQAGSVTALAWDASSSRLAVSCEANAICIFEGGASDPDFRLVATLSGHLNTVLDIAWHLDGKTLVSTGVDQTVRLWTLVADRTAFALPTPESTPLTDLDISADRRWLAAGGVGGELEIFDARALVHAGTLRSARGAEIKSLAWSPDGDAIALSDADGWISIRHWPERTGERELWIAPNAVDTVRWLPDGLAVAAALRNGEVVLWPLRENRPVGLRGEGHAGSALGLAVDTRHNRLVSSGDRGEVILWDVAEREQIARLPSTETVNVPPTARDIVTLAGEGRIAAVAGNDGNLILYHLDQRRIETVLAGNSPQIEGAAFDAEGALIASVSSDGFLDVRIIRDRSTFAMVKVYPQERRVGPAADATYHLRRLVWLADHDAIAISTSNGEVKIISHDVEAWQRRLRKVFRLE